MDIILAILSVLVNHMHSGIVVDTAGLHRWSRSWAIVSATVNTDPSGSNVVLEDGTSVTTSGGLRSLDGRHIFMACYIQPIPKLADPSSPPKLDNDKGDDQSTKFDVINSNTVGPVFSHKPDDKDRGYHLLYPSAVWVGTPDQPS